MYIGNEYFTIKKDLKMEDVYKSRYEDLENCYGRPSSIKIRINNYWRDTIYSNCKVIRYGVCGYNCNMFSLNAIVEIDNNMYYLYITKTRNEIHKIIE